ncbi:hypothetical protein MKW98_004812 [Papaver atlanticum]|uniref:Uncharacterized protein n=1 Tax=Papaver atlanticum TaxID=357466 RepID=A0AAD4SIR4_9MAGN|nr:hypothetical protein MKW98_004812 [Papaver atlanticum]
MAVAAWAEQQQHELNVRVRRQSRTKRHVAKKNGDVYIVHMAYSSPSVQSPCMLT